MKVRLVGEQDGLSPNVSGITKDMLTGVIRSMNQDCATVGFPNFDNNVFTLTRYGKEQEGSWNIRFTELVAVELEAVKPELPKIIYKLP